MRSSFPKIVTQNNSPPSQKGNAQSNIDVLSSRTMRFLRNELKIRTDYKGPLNYKINPPSPVEIIFHQQRNGKENRKCLANMTHSMCGALRNCNKLAAEQINSGLLYHDGLSTVAVWKAAISKLKHLLNCQNNSSVWSQSWKIPKRVNLLPKQMD